MQNFLNLMFCSKYCKCTVYNDSLDPCLFLNTNLDMEFLEVLTEGLERVLMVRGGGREVITIYS